MAPFPSPRAPLNKPRAVARATSVSLSFFFLSLSLFSFRCRSHSLSLYFYCLRYRSGPQQHSRTSPFAHRVSHEHAPSSRTRHRTEQVRGELEFTEPKFRTQSHDAVDFWSGISHFMVALGASKLRMSRPKPNPIIWLDVFHQDVVNQFCQPFVLLDALMVG